MKIAYFLRSLDLFFVKKDKDLYAIVPKNSTEEFFALKFLNKDKIYFKVGSG